MSRPNTTIVGPLIAASATKIALSQKAAAAQYLVLNGAAGTATANNICLSQTPGGAGALTLNGSLASGSPAVANIANNQPVYITSAANDSGVTFTVSGVTYGAGGGPISSVETITGANASTVSTSKTFWSVTSITVSGATAGAVTVGTYSTASLDKARRVILTSAGNDSGITFAVTGTDWDGTPIGETITGANAGVASSVLDYLTVTSVRSSGAVASTVTVGTNGVAGSRWVRFDELATQGPISIQCSVTGTVNYTVQQTLQDPNGPADIVTLSTMQWLNHPDTNLNAATATIQSNYAYQPLFARVVLNSGTGSVSSIFTQAFLG